MPKEGAGTTPVGVGAGKDKSKIQSFGCKEFGHYKNKCPKKKTSEDATSAVFVGSVTAAVYCQPAATPLTVVDCFEDGAIPDDFFDNFSYEEEVWTEPDAFETFGPMEGADSGSNEHTSKSHVCVSVAGQVLDADYEMADAHTDDGQTVPELLPRVDDASSDGDLSVTESSIGMSIPDSMVGQEIFCSVNSSIDIEAGYVAWGEVRLLLDSGAGIHASATPIGISERQMCPDKKFSMANGTLSTSPFKGIWHLQDANGTAILLNDTYYCPDFKRHLVSIPRLLDAKCKLVDASVTNIVMAAPNGAKLIFERCGEDGLYYLRAKPVTQTAAEPAEHVMLVRGVGRKLDIAEAHRILGHCDETRVRAYAKAHNWTLTGHMKPCQSCGESKAHQKPLAKSTENRIQTPGGRLFLDLSGPLPRSFGGSEYWFLVVDDATRRKWDYYLKTKDMIGDSCRDLFGRLKTLGIDLTKTIIRCDNAGENLSHVKKAAAEFGITKFELTPRGTPQLNGVVERAFPFLAARGKAMMFDAKMKESFRHKLWPYAYHSAVVLDNLLPRGDKGETAYELFGEKMPVHPGDLKGWG